MSDEFEVVWHDPPPSGKYGTRLERFVELLRANPGQWGELPPTEDGPYSGSVTTVARRRWTAERDGITFRSVSTTSQNRIRLFGRFDPPGKSPDLRSVDSRREAK